MCRLAAPLFLCCRERLRVIRAACQLDCLSLDFVRKIVAFQAYLHRDLAISTGFPATGETCRKAYYYSSVPQIIHAVISSDRISAANGVTSSHIGWITTWTIYALHYTCRIIVCCSESVWCTDPTQEPRALLLRKNGSSYPATYMPCKSHG